MDTSEPAPVLPRLFRGGLVFDGERFRAGVDLRTDAAGRVAEVGPGLRPAADEVVVDLDGRWLLPGLVDCHVHFREPGLERKEGYDTGSRGALHGGVTTVCEIQNNPPLLTSVALLEAKFAQVGPKSRVDFACYGSLVEEALPHLGDLAGRVPAVKCFLGCSTGAGGVDDPATLRRWFAAAAAAGLPIVAHCEDNAVMQRAAAELSGIDAERHDLRRPVEAEVESVRTAIAAAAEVGARLHVFHVSTDDAMSLVAEARAAGLPVTASTAPHYLSWTADDAAAMPQHRLKVNPSIKSARHRDGLARRVERGEFVAIGTDHAPHPLTEKTRDYAHAPSGFPSVDLLLPLVFDVHDRRGVPLEPLLASVTSGPVDEFGLRGKGRLVAGADADLVVVSPHCERLVDEAALPSRSKWSPYHGRRLRGFPERVFLRGREVFRDGAFPGAPTGRPVPIVPAAERVAE